MNLALKPYVNLFVSYYGKSFFHPPFLVYNGEQPLRSFEIVTLPSSKLHGQGFNVKFEYHGVTFGCHDAIINIFRALTRFKPNGDEKVRYIFRDKQLLWNNSMLMSLTIKVQIWFVYLFFLIKLSKFEDKLFQEGENVVVFPRLCP